MGRSRGDVSKLMERETRIIELRKGGKTWEQIGRELGMTGGGAHTAYMRALKRIPAEAVAELRTMDNERINALIDAGWPKAMAGSARHIEVITRLLERRAKLFGLDAPQLHHIEVLTQDVLDQAIAQLEAQLAELG